MNEYKDASTWFRVAVENDVGDDFNIIGDYDTREQAESSLAVALANSIGRKYMIHRVTGIQS